MASKVGGGFKVDKGKYVDPGSLQTFIVLVPVPRLNVLGVAGQGGLQSELTHSPFKARRSAFRKSRRVLSREMQSVRSSRYDWPKLPSIMSPIKSNCMVD
jgi:hypothetical protein